jgi:hypothetical protein
LKGRSSTEGAALGTALSLRNGAKILAQSGYGSHDRDQAEFHWLFE